MKKEKEKAKPPLKKRPAAPPPPSTATTDEALQREKMEATQAVKGKREGGSYEAMYNERRIAAERCKASAASGGDGEVVTQANNDGGGDVERGAEGAAVGDRAVITSQANLEEVEQDEESNVNTATAAINEEEEAEEYIPTPGAERVDGEGYIQEPDNDDDDDDDMQDEEEAIPIARPVDIEEERRASAARRASQHSSVENGGGGGEAPPAWLGDNIAVAVRDSTTASSLDDKEGKSWRGKFRKYKKWIICLALGAVGGAVAAIVVVTTSSSSSGGDTPAPTPTPGTRISNAPTATPTTNAPTTTAYGDYLKDGVFDQFDIQPRTPQSEALSWLANVDTYSNSANLTDDRLVQRYALATLYYSTNGDTAWVEQLDFLSAKSECEWKGVVDGSVLGVALCDENEMVTELILSENGLNGPIPPEIGTFSTLTKLNFRSNTLTGSIPDEITNLVDLTELSVGENDISGPLPTDIGNFVNLVGFSFNFNKINGAIPESIGSCAKLEQLSAEGNELTGPLPTSMSGLDSIQTLHLEDNKLNGSVPSELSALTDTLRNIWLQKNDFTGSVNAFCQGDKKINLFYADCLPSAFPTTPAEVECSCCTICCSDNPDGGNSNCLPN